MNFNALRERTEIPDQTFPINIFFNEDFYLHWHDHIEWVFVKKGKSRVQIDAAYEDLEEGELAFINSKQLHRATALIPGTEVVSIVFNEALVRGNGVDLTDLHYFLPYLDKKILWPSTMKKNDLYMEETGKAFATLLNEFECRNPGYELLIKAELLRIFGLFFRYSSEVSARSLPCCQQHDDFSRFLQVLRERYNESFTISDAANMVSLSPNHFCRVFKQVTGKTFIEYLHFLRINEAERMLTETGESITTIAGKVGFSDINYFGRVFKKIKNQTPSSVRRLSRS